MTPESSRLLAKIKQKAVVNNDKFMILKIEKIKKDNDITEEIKNYKLKEEKNE